MDQRAPGEASHRRSAGTLLEPRAVAGATEDPFADLLDGLEDDDVRTAHRDGGAELKRFFADNGSDPRSRSGSGRGDSRPVPVAPAPTRAVAAERRRVAEDGWPGHNYNEAYVEIEQDRRRNVALRRSIEGRRPTELWDVDEAVEEAPVAPTPPPASTPSDWRDSLRTYPPAGTPAHPSADALDWLDHLGAPEPTTRTTEAQMVSTLWGRRAGLVLCESSETLYARPGGATGADRLAHLDAAFAQRVGAKAKAERRKTHTWRWVAGVALAGLAVALLQMLLV